MEVTVMSYNIENMNRMFSNDKVKPAYHARAQKIAQVITSINPHVLGICEAANSPQEHANFIDTYLPGSGYELAAGASRGAQNLVFYFKPPISLISVDDALSFYGPWSDDVDNDSLDEAFHWERKPLEAIFKVGDGGRLRAILVHAKSKGIFSVVDLANFQNLSLGNRKKLIGQANRLRKRIDELVDQQPATPLVVMGDMNDGPGFDAYEMKLGKSFVETVMGNVFSPEKCLHNAHYYLSHSTDTKKDLWTIEFTDPIVSHPWDYKHRVWIDHILLSPDMLKPNGKLRLKPNSAKIAEKNAAAKEASDHSAVFCKLISGDAPVTPGLSE